MKKLAYLLLACALCSAFALTACSGDSQFAGGGTTQDNIEKMIVGTWVTADRGKLPELTDEKVVLNILSSTEARVNAQLQLTPDGPLTWADYWEADVAIDGNKVTITSHPAENAVAVNELTIMGISDDDFTASREMTLTIDGTEVNRTKDTARYERVNDDYGESILGTWESISASGKREDFRCEFKDDGTFVYYVKDGDKWKASRDTISEYIVAANLLSTRWEESSQEKRENWDISIDGDTMTWTAVRVGGVGKAFVGSRTLKKIA